MKELREANPHAMTILFEEIEERIVNSSPSEIATTIDGYVNSNRPALIRKAKSNPKCQHLNKLLAFSNKKEIVNDQWYKRKREQANSFQGEEGIGVEVKYLILLSWFLDYDDFDDFQKKNEDKISRSKGSYVKQIRVQQKGSKSFFDEYDLKARIFPSLISNVPAIGLILIYIDSVGLFKNELTFHEITSISLILLIIIAIMTSSIFLAIPLSKIISRQVFRQSGLKGLPTTSWLLYSNGHYSHHRKDLIRSRFEKVFGDTLPDETEETNAPEEALAKLRESNQLIRLFVGRGKLVFDQLVKYGFVRNLIGHSLFALVYSLVGTLYSIAVQEPFVWLPFLLFACFSSIILVFRKALIVTTAKDYAHQLHAEFLLGAEG